VRFEKVAPVVPALLSNVVKWREAPVVLDQKQKHLWAASQQQFNQLKVCFMSPGSVMERGSTLFVTYLDRCVCADQDEFHQRLVAPPANCMQDAFLEFIASDHRLPTHCMSNEYFKITFAYC
jgi:hypothetical protein